MIEIKPLEVQDLIDVEEIHNRVSHFPMPNVNSKNYPIQKVIKLNGEIVGSAFAQITSEISLSLEPELSYIQKAKIIKELFGILLGELLRSGIEDTHVFIIPESDIEYKEFLIKHFNFVEAKGIAMYLRP